MTTFTITATVGGSRQFGNSFLIRWTPSQTIPQLQVQIFAGGTLLASNTFTPDNATQAVNGAASTYEVRGMLAALFDAGGISGTLVALQLNMIANGVDTSFKGTIGLW